MPESGASTGALDLSAWPDAIYRVLVDSRIHHVAYVPDAGHARLIELCRNDPAMSATVLTTEEEGVALLAGAWAASGVPVHHAGDMTDAVGLAFRRARALGAVVLLSPGCASFDMFRDFEDRGDRFKAAVRGLGEEG